MRRVSVPLGIGMRESEFSRAALLACALSLVRSVRSPDSCVALNDSLASAWLYVTLALVPLGIGMRESAVLQEDFLAIPVTLRHS